VVIAVEDDSVHVLRHDGSPQAGWPRFAMMHNPQARTPSPVVVDLDRNGSLDVLMADNAGVLRAWQADGSALAGWPQLFAQDPEALNAWATQSSPVVGDLDGDGVFEVVLGAEDGRVYAWHADGTTADGFPIQTGGAVRGSAALGDVDGDGAVDLVVAANDRRVTVWRFAGSAAADRLPWPTFRHDARNTGVVGVAVPASHATAQRLTRLHLPRPSPTRGASGIVFETDVRQAVTLRVYDVSGRLVRELVREVFAPGAHTVQWDGTASAGQRVPSGIYWVEMRSATRRETRRLVVLR
jgi:hypothetical protein